MNKKRNENEKRVVLSYNIKRVFFIVFCRPIKVIKNFFFCLQYPFWKSRNVWDDSFCGYSCTWYDDIPNGWRRAFGKALSRDLKIALKKDNLLKQFRFIQIKEKYGSLRLYSQGYGEHSLEVIRRYEEKSKDYCIICGNPAKYVTYNWIEYYCEKCIVNQSSQCLPIEKYKQFFESDH